MSDKEAYTLCLRNGLELKSKDVGICDLRNTCKNQIIERKYQVFNAKESKIYNNISEAVDKFIEYLGK